VLLTFTKRCRAPELALTLLQAINNQESQMTQNNKIEHNDLK
jgi:hypothetical protein